MRIKVHPLASTTPEIRKYIHTFHKSQTELARELDVCEATIRRWKNRTDMYDRPHYTVRKLPTAFSPEKTREKPLLCWI